MNAKAKVALDPDETISRGRAPRTTPRFPMPGLTGADWPSTQSAIELSRWSLEEAERIVDLQIAFGRSMFDAWLRGTRELSDNGRRLCSPVLATESLAALAEKTAREASHPDGTPA